MQPNQQRRMRIILRERTRLRLLSAQRVLPLFIFVFVLSVGAAIFLNLFQSKETLAAASGDYRTSGSGNWNSIGTWERYNGTSWVAAIATPTSADGVISIESGHTVSITANVTVDQVEVASGGTLSNSASTLTVANGTGSDLNVSGTVNLNTGGTITINAGAVITILNGGIYNYNGGTQTATGWVVNNGGTYVHNVNGITIPTSTWGSSSTLKITGVTTSDVWGTYQDFGNVIYDCTSQTGSPVEFRDNLKTIAGDFTVLSTGTGGTWFQRLTAATPVTISGNYSQSGGTVYMTKGAVFSWNLMGNFTLTGGTFTEVEKYGMPVLNVFGNFLITGGTFNHTESNEPDPNVGHGVVNLYGNYSRTGGLHTETGTGTHRGEYYFTKTGTQTFSHTGGTITNTVNFTVVNGSVLDLASYQITGGGTFTLQSGGGLILGSANGITSSGASGNIQVTGTRSFSTGGDYTYAGTSTQVTGNGLPSLVHNWTINNSSGVTTTASFTVSNILTFTEGNITTNAFVVSLGTSQANLGILSRVTGHVIGFIRRWMNTALTSDILFPVGTVTYYEGANVSVTSAPTSGTITATFTDAANSWYGLYVQDNGVAVTSLADGYWTMTTGDGMSGGAFNLDLYANSLVPIISDYTAMRVVRKAIIPDPWTVNGTHATGTGSNAAPIAHRTSINIWGIFSIGSPAGIPLPIDLAFFNANPNGNSVLCAWQTVSETNNNYFTVERSLNGKDFEAVGTVKGTGNSTSEINYSFEDKNATTGISYYRLRQTDFDGSSTFSNSVSVAINPSGVSNEFAIEDIYPNPFIEHFTITWNAEVESIAGIALMNSSGKIIFSHSQKSEKGMNHFNFRNGVTLPSGIYFASVYSNSKTQIQKIIKY